MVNSNPILRYIKQVGISVRAFAVVYDCSQASLRNVLYGYVDIVPETVKKSLTKAGFSIDNIDEDYKAWRQDKAKKELEVRKNVQAG